MDQGGMQLGMNLKSIVPHQEYLLQGSILDTAQEVLLHRLRGLCDNAEMPPETFHDHEMVFLIKGTSPQPSQPVLFRARKSLDHPESPWHLRYLSQVEDKLRHTLSRSCIDVGCSDNVVQFLNEMGFRQDHEFVVRGFLFRKGRMKVTVSKIFREQIQEDMKNFSEQLKPLVQLEKTDHRRLQTM
ncbi:mediator of RNA polymerase II transcription subunit 18-like isoform X1 [Liolophura sinensis]|uniref:mediator of RNA polymerase II transcription subunit 18-like isoform X1 n=1 Tax=Liolophura sinensis TaxID=3198878 RepID=UPI003157FAE9